LRILKLLGNNKVPDELPDLATDDIEKRLSEETSVIKESDIPKETIPIQPDQPKIGSKEVFEPKIEIIKEPIINKIEENRVVTNDKTFFSELNNSLSRGMKDPDEYEEWFNNKIKGRDVVTDMKEFWNQKKDSTMMQVLNDKFKERISKKTLELESLEKDWRNIYFKMVEKEEEIREKERELKKILHEFLELCKVKEKERIDKAKKKKDDRESGRIIKIM
jgi:hypothetical protein